MFSNFRFRPTFPVLLPFLIVSAALQTASVQHAGAQAAARTTPLSATVTNHYIVAYRNNTIPTNAEAHTSLAGARILSRQEHLGMAVVQANGTADDATNLRQLAAQPDVDFVVHDRMVYGHQIATMPVAPSNPNPTLGVHSPLAAPVSTVTVVSDTPTTPTPGSDSYYNSPQGWAVRQVGGYGKGVAGGATHGPWDVTMGKGVKIAILDSGVDAMHPDIAPNLIFNLSEIDQTKQTGLPSACDDGTPQDQEGHGTWTASLAAGAAGAGTGLVVGVAPQASILNIKVLERMPSTSTSGSVAAQCTAGEATGLMSWVIKGINDAVAQHADVISMSLGSMVDLQTGDGAGLQALFNRATYAAAQAGAVLIAAAGNDGFDFSNPRYIELPAQARGVLAIVASTNPACAENLAAMATCAAGAVTLPYYSNFGGPLNAVAAPGGSLPAGGDTAASGWVRGACSSGKPNTTDGQPDATHSYGCFNLGHTGYVQAMGTSASAPLAAGVAALLKAANPGWDAATIIAKMRATGTVTASMPYPQVNAALAIGLTN